MKQVGLGTAGPYVPTLGLSRMGMLDMYGRTAMKAPQ